MPANLLELKWRLGQSPNVFDFSFDFFTRRAIMSRPRRVDIFRANTQMTTDDAFA